MKLTLPWLKDHLDTGASADEVAAKLTALGLEVEEVVDPGAALDGFTVARVRDTRPHPEAERLRLCTVETARGVLEVVCGAPNARPGLLGVFAHEGLVIPATGDVLRRAVIRGVESQGMLCSWRELKLGQDHAGIIELPETAEVGAPAAAALGIEGPVIDVAVTPDRADCLSVHGIARDLAAGGLGRLRQPDFSSEPGRGPRGLDIRLDFAPETAAACPLFVGRLIRGVRNGPSPAWLRQRLEAVGVRPISALVDITNYVTHDLGRPLHVFDAAKLWGDVVLRLARPGEQLRALDGRTYTLDPEMTVIADETGPVSLGGIMGGEETGVTEETRDVLLEVALFDPARTARTGRKLGIESDARLRFERGVDPELVLPGSELATRLILALCGGEAAPAVVAGEVPRRQAPIRYQASTLPRLAGIALDDLETRRILEALGFEVRGGPLQFEVRPPSWRHDVGSEACIVEELARVHGYDRIPPVPVTRTEAVSPGVLSPEQRRRGQIRRAVAAQGYLEAVTWSFLPAEQARLFGAAEPVMLRNPISSELDAMRPSLLPNLLAAAARNLARKHEEGALFELGPRFTGATPGEQATAVAGVRFGRAGGRHWAAPDRPVDALDAKGDALAALAAAGVKVEAVQLAGEAPPWYHPGRSGRLALGPNELACFGELHPRVLKLYDIAVPVAGFELDLEPLPKPRAKGGRARPPLEPLPFPPVDRDFAFLVDAEVPAEELLRAVRGAEKKLIREVRLFDVYAGKGIEPGRKSLAVAVRLQAPDRTLTEIEVEPIAQRIVAAAQRAVGAVLRR
ncbi:MAG TPA: phenylalanine--tRNA ligase subunit beta [Geminicoccaceae bacterium]|nr:phenylalanine--tRNA ligase subunit beta [Geminicoccaceae bacterium]